MKLLSPSLEKFRVNSLTAQADFLNTGMGPSTTVMPPATRSSSRFFSATRKIRSPPGKDLKSKRMKKILFPLFVLLVSLCSAQEIQKEINEQVWKPFTKAIMTQDHESFISLHSKDLVRAERNGKRILSYDEYRVGMEVNWPKWKETNKKDNVQYTFELRFTERISNGSLAYEVGYFKNETIKGGEKRVGYGKFHVTLRKEIGTWKILVDSDSNEGNTVGEKDFLAALPME